MRFSFDVDLGAVFEGMPDDEAVIAVERSLLGSARVTHARLLNRIKEDAGLPEEDRDEAVRPHLQAIMLSLMANANWSYEALPDDATINMELPFEKKQGEQN
jgi:hypothetical protein